MFATLLQSVQIDATVARIFLIFALPICMTVTYTDLRGMRIPNWAVDLLGGGYIVLGLLVMPSWELYGWQLLHLPIGLALGFLFYAGGAIGAGDAKFVAAAAPFVAFQDLFLVLVLFNMTLLAGFTTHRVIKVTPLRQMAPDWKSWHVGHKFPMGLCLGGTLAIYLCLGTLFGT